MTTTLSRHLRIWAAACALVLALTPAAALAQQAPAAAPAAASAAPAQEPGFFANVGRWIDQQTASARAAWQGVGTQMQSFGREASAVAQTSAENARQAAGTMARIRNARVVTGYERCGIAANGAPDCQKAVVALCKAQGLETGTSLEMTAAEDCPVKVYMAGRNSGPECTSFTFVSRALCQ